MAAFAFLAFQKAVIAALPDAGPSSSSQNGNGLLVPPVPSRVQLHCARQRGQR